MEKTLGIKGIDLAALFGAADAHLRLIEGSFAVNVVVRNDNIKLKGDDIQLDLAKEVIHEMKQTLARKGSLTAKDVRQLIEVVTIDNGHDNQVPKMLFIMEEKEQSLPGQMVSKNTLILFKIMTLF